MSELNKELNHKPTPTKTLEAELPAIKSKQTLENDSTLQQRRAPKKQPKPQIQPKPDLKNVRELDQLEQKIKALSEKKLSNTQKNITFDLKKIKEYRKELESQLKKEAKVAFTPQEKAKLRRQGRKLRNQLDLAEVKLSKQQDHLKNAKEVKPLYSPETGTFIRQELKNGQIQPRNQSQDQNRPIQLESVVLTTQQLNPTPAPTPTPGLKRKAKSQKNGLEETQAPPHWQQHAVEKNLENREHDLEWNVKTSGNRSGNLRT